MKYMGETIYVLGIKILKDLLKGGKQFLGLSQETYIKKMLNRCHIHD